jgi:hypothetical protein
MNSPYNAEAILRTLIVYAICVTLAIIVGFLVTNPMTFSNMGLFGILGLILISPLLMRWHYPLLVLSWNLNLCIFFLKGGPNLWLVAFGLSLGISLLERALSSRMHFIRVPQVTWPLVCLLGVVLVTAKLTGGIGLRALGAEVYGGRKYISLLVGILSYFALTSRRIPPERAGLYVALFFLGGAMSFIGDIFPLAPRWAYPLFWVFLPNIYSYSQFQVGEVRLGGFAATGFSIWVFLLARYGIRGIFLSGKPWRLVAFILSFVSIFLGGFRYQLVSAGMIFISLFFLEGMHRTKLLPVLTLVGLFAIATIAPVASKLPFSFQRCMAFLPLDLDPQAKEAAQGSWDWRVNMWKALLPQVPQHLLLGKGFAISPEEFNEMMGRTAFAAAAGQIDPSQSALALSYDYHNGPLSVIIPFGIWGVITLLWFLAAGFRVLHSNYQYGDPSLQTINAFLFVEYLVASFMFMFAGGAVSTDMARFVGFLGLSIALNGGVCRPAPQPVQAEGTLPRPTHVLPQPRPAFPR